jgi:hypothetical protein
LRADRCTLLDATLLDATLLDARLIEATLIDARRSAPIAAASVAPGEPGRLIALPNENAAVSGPAPLNCWARPAKSSFERGSRS